MSGSSTTSAATANSTTVNMCGGYRTSVRSIAYVMQKSRVVFPHKTAAHLSEITGYSVRACEYWLAGTRSVPSDALASLIRCDHGAQFVAALMTDAAPAWWRKAFAFFAAVDAGTLHRRARRKIREALDADREINAAIARADSLLVHDADFYGPIADAVRDMAGVPHRPVASKRG